MPQYGYKCDKCGNFDSFATIAKRNEPVECHLCGLPSKRDVEYELQSGTQYHEEHTRYSSAMGVNPKRIKEMEKKYPNSSYTPDGKLIISSRQDKLTKMKERGLTEIE